MLIESPSTTEVKSVPPLPLYLRIIGIVGLLIIIAFITAVISLKTFSLVGYSMEPTYQSGNIFIADRLFFRVLDLKRGDTVIYNPPAEDHVSLNAVFVGRIVGLPGENVVISGGKIYINDKVLNESYVKKGSITSGNTMIENDKKYKIPNNKYLILGDNRENSYDSRFFGFVGKNDIDSRILVKL